MSGTSNPQGNGDSGRSKSLGTGVGLLVAAAALFGVCSLVQHAFGSSMFDSKYSDVGLMGGLLLNITWWPGWLGTILIGGLGVLTIFGSLSKK